MKQLRTKQVTAMTQAYVTAEVCSISTPEICLKPSFNLTNVTFLLISAKKSAQYAESAIFHMIDMFLCPEQEPYYSAIESRPAVVHPENIRICESLLREMNARASWHRTVVMESLVAICSNKPNLKIDDMINKLTDVLSVVMLFLFSVPNILPLCWLSPSPTICPRKMFKPTIC